MGPTNDSGQPARFGPIDPYCWLGVAPFVVIAVLFVLGGSVPIAIGFLILAALLVTFDSWANRPTPRTMSRRPAAARMDQRQAAAGYGPAQQQSNWSGEWSGDAWSANSPRVEPRERPAYPGRPGVAAADPRSGMKLAR